MVELQELAELGRIEVAKVVVPAGRLAGSRPPPCRAGRIAVVDIELELRRHDRGVDRVRRKRLEVPVRHKSQVHPHIASAFHLRLTLESHIDGRGNLSGRDHTVLHLKVDTFPGGDHRVLHTSESQHRAGGSVHALHLERPVHIGHVAHHIDIGGDINLIRGQQRERLHDGLDPVLEINVVLLAGVIHHPSPVARCKERKEGDQ